ncbi:hypothetical protein [Nannocystis radixulma]|uniref:Uncharacterized protein n=1 Tax=Nannocystis radixulma TaxID=2995305 RepID=A0ABT5BAR4_9BACT|nr:hypothetical protein [Nannocystis radixulma]MDC0671229.1 hypothetical protein [Nannocystis radixulma]
MSKTIHVLLAGLMMLASGPAAAATPKDAIKKIPGVAPAKTPLLQLVNGHALVGTRCSGEFPDYDHTMKFFARPSSICVRWDDRDPVASATWELWKDKPGPADEKIGSGTLPTAVLTGGTHSTFDVSLAALPQYNETDTSQKYFVKVISKRTADATNTQVSVRGTLVHQPKSAEPKPQPADPYVCSPSPDKHVRMVALTMPKMTVNQTTSTAGDGDRDELYIKVDRKGPGEDTGARRLPALDDYYEAKQSETFTTTWTNKDQKNVGRPNLWTGKLKHNEKVTLAITAMEQDNAELGEIRNSLIEALREVEKAALETNNSYGAIVGAVAAGLLVGASLIPRTNGHDFIGFVGLRLENQCGHIRTAWVTFRQWKVDGVGTLRNDLISTADHESYESRLVVHSLPVSGFQKEGGIDWGDFKPVGLKDTFWWQTGGSSSSGYTFTLQSKLYTSEEVTAYEKAMETVKKVPGMGN